MKELRLCRRLLEEADDLRFENPREAVRAAETARDSAAALDRKAVGESEWLTLQAEAWGVCGSALRAVSELGEAEGAINVALAFLEAPELEAGRRLATQARLTQRAAYLRRDQCRFAEALHLIDEAIAVFREQRDAEATAGAWADRGLILGRAGRQQEAVHHLREALEQLDPDRSPRNFLAAIYNTALYLYELADDSPEVEALAVKWLDLACRGRRLLPPGGLGALKLETLRGLTALRLGQVERGLDGLWRTQEGFERLGAVWEQALTLLHLAEAYLAQGRTENVKGVASRLFPVFQSMKNEREASAALMLFYNAAHAETATIELVGRVSEALRKAQARSLARRDGS